MPEALITISTQYADPDANSDFANDFPNEPAPAPVLIVPHAFVGRVDYDEVSDGVASVADLTATDEEIALDFGDVVEASGFFIKNSTGQDLSVALNGVLAGTEDAGVTSAAATLSTQVGLLATAVAGLKTVLSAQLAILNAFTGLDDAADIVAAIATANTAIGTANTAVTTTATTNANTALGTALDEDGTAIFTLPDGGALACVIPVNADTPVESISLYTTTTQAGDGEVEFKIFGSDA